MNEDFEVWENVTGGKVYVNHFDHNGQVRQEVVHAGRTTLVSAKERKLLNSDRTVSVELDVFKNGRLRPVDPVSIASNDGDLVENPNHLTTQDMRDLFSIRNHMKFRNAISEISSDIVLRHLLELAESGDEELDVTFNQRKVIAEALNEKADVEVDVAEIEQVGESKASPKPVSVS